MRSSALLCSSLLFFFFVIFWVSLLFYLWLVYASFLIVFIALWSLPAAGELPPSHSPSPSNRLTFLGSTLFAGVAFNKACFDMQTTMLTTRPQRVLRRRTLETKQNNKKKRILFILYFSLFPPVYFWLFGYFVAKPSHVIELRIFGHHWSGKNFLSRGKHYNLPTFPTWIECFPPPKKKTLFAC